MVGRVPHEQSAICRIDLDGVQTTRNIHAAYERVRAALAGRYAVKINCRDTTEFDFSLIQLILCAKRSAEQTGTPLTLLLPPGDAWRNTLGRAGLLAACNGEADPGEEFWFKGHEVP